MLQNKNDEKIRRFWIEESRLFRKKKWQKKKWYLLPLIIARGRQDVTKGYGVMVAQATGKICAGSFFGLLRVAA